MPLFADKKRKLYNEENDSPRKRQAVDNEHETGGNDDWADDEMNEIFTQAENLNRIDDLIASSQIAEAASGVENTPAIANNLGNRLKPKNIFDRQTNVTGNVAKIGNVDSHPSVCRVTCPPSYMVASEENNKVVSNMRLEMENMKQQLYTKDGQVKFLMDSNLKLNKKLTDQALEASNTLRTKSEGFDRERANLRSQIKALQMQLEFKQHEKNRSSFVTGTPRAQNHSASFSVRTKSFGEHSPSLSSVRLNIEGTRFQNQGTFQGRAKVGMADGFVQAGPDDLGQHKKAWKLKGKGSGFRVAYMGGVLGMQTSLRHYANQLEFGKTGCDHNYQVCNIKNRLRSSDCIKNPTGVRIFQMYNELLSKKVMCTGTELLHGSRFRTSDPRPGGVDPGLIPFLEEATTDLKSYLSMLVRRRQQQLSSGVALPPTMRRKHKIRQEGQKPVSPTADLLVTVHEVIALCRTEEFRRLHEMPFFSEFMSTIVDLINKESVEDEFEVVMMCMQIINLSLKRIEPCALESYSALLDDSGLVTRVLQDDFNFDLPREVRDLTSLLVIEAVTSLSAHTTFGHNACREMCQQCILLPISRLMSHHRLKSKSIFPSLQIQFQKLVRSLLPHRLRTNQGGEPSCCPCITKIFTELLLSLDELVTSSSDSCDRFEMDVIRGGMSSLHFVVSSFPRVLGPGRGMFLYIMSSLQRFFKKHEDSLTRGSDYNELLVLFDCLKVDS